MRSQHTVQCTNPEQGIVATLESHNPDVDPLDKTFSVHGNLTIESKGGELIAHKSFVSYDGQRDENGEKSWDWKRCTIQSVTVNEKEGLARVSFVGPELCGIGVLETFAKTIRINATNGNHTER